MSPHAGENLARLMAAAGLSARQVAARAGLDERTVRAILAGECRPHAQTIGRLAAALDVPADEFFLDPAHLLYRHFDRSTNPLVEEVLDAHRELFAGWTAADFDELHSRVGTGGPLTREGVLAAAEQMNRNRELHEKLDVLLESSAAELTAALIETLSRQVAVRS